MKNITSSASKLVLLYIVGILGLLALFAGCFAVATNTFGDATKTIVALFGNAVTFVLGFYFGYKGDTPPSSGGTVTTSTKVEATQVTAPAEAEPAFQGK